MIYCNHENGKLEIKIEGGFFTIDEMMRLIDKFRSDVIGELPMTMKSDCICDMHAIISGISYKDIMEKRKEEAMSGLKMLFENKFGNFIEHRYSNVEEKECESILDKIRQIREEREKKSGSVEEPGEEKAGE